MKNLAGNTAAFSEACYDENSIEELQEPHAPENADETDCKTWGITAQEWSEAIEVALTERLAV